MEQTNYYIDQIGEELNVIFRDLNSEIAFRFIKNVPEIFQNIFENFSNQYLHSLYLQDKRTDKELTCLSKAINFLSPQNQKNKQKNLFSLINQTQINQFFEYNIKYLPKHLHYLITTNQMGHPILQKYREFLLFPDQLIKSINGETYIILNSWELFFFILLNKIKTFKVKDISNKYLEQYQNNTNHNQQELTHNPLLTLLRRYLHHFSLPPQNVQTSLYQSNYQQKKDKLMFLVEDLLITEYTFQLSYSYSSLPPYSLTLPNDCTLLSIQLLIHSTFIDYGQSPSIPQSTQNLLISLEQILMYCITHYPTQLPSQQHALSQLAGLWLLMLQPWLAKDNMYCVNAVQEYENKIYQTQNSQAGIENDHLKTTKSVIAWNDFQNDICIQQMINPDLQVCNQQYVQSNLQFYVVLFQEFIKMFADIKYDNMGHEIQTLYDILKVFTFGPKNNYLFNGYISLDQFNNYYLQNSNQNYDIVQLNDMKTNNAIKITRNLKHYSRKLQQNYEDVYDKMGYFQKKFYQYLRYKTHHENIEQKKHLIEQIIQDLNLIYNIQDVKIEYQEKVDYVQHNLYGIKNRKSKIIQKKSLLSKTENNFAKIINRKIMKKEDDNMSTLSVYLAKFLVLFIIFIFLNFLIGHLINV